MALRAPFRPRLALRIWIVGLAQIVVVGVGFFVLLRLMRPPGGGRIEEHARFVAPGIERTLADPRALDRELARVREGLHASVTVVDPDGAVVAAHAHPGTPRCSHVGEAVPHGPFGCVPVALVFPDGRVGTLEYAAPAGPPPPLGLRVVALVLLVVGVSSLLLARSLTRPLRRLSTAARALGGGDLRARVNLARTDELGDVARAFDEMAERVGELLRAEKELLANVSHELRTPLARIRVALDLAAEGDAAVARESLGEIAGDLDELERLIGDVLTAARLDLGDGTAPAGVPPLRRERVNLGDLVARAAARFRAAHPERGLRVELAADIPRVDGDPVLLRRVIDNLLENAHKYTEQPDAGVTLAARPDGVRVAIEIVDEGIGIAAGDLPSVFRPFFRADKSRTRATGGLGLGLALAKRIVEAHGGTIELVSAPNEGTRAIVRLPAA